MPEHYVYGSGITLDEPVQLTNVSKIRPTSVVPQGNMEDSVNQATLGIAMALSTCITFEIVSEGDAPKAAAMHSWNSQWIAIWLSCYLGVRIQLPLQSSAPAEKCEISSIRTLSLVGFHRMFDPPKRISSSQIKEGMKLWSNFETMMKDERFSHAASVAATVALTEPRVSVRMAAIWSGIESLLGFDHELNFRISTAVAILLEDEPDKRKKLFDDTKKLYTLRSKCIHGSHGSANTEKEGAESSLILLRKLILFFVKRGGLLNKDEQSSLFLHDLKDK